MATRLMSHGLAGKFSKVSKEKQSILHVPVILSPSLQFQNKQIV